MIDKIFNFLFVKEEIKKDNNMKYYEKEIKDVMVLFDDIKGLNTIERENAFLKRDTLKREDMLVR